MKRQVILEFEVNPELEQMDLAYQNAIGSVNIAHEMIICAVAQHQMKTLIRAIETEKQKKTIPGWKELIEYIMRFHQAQNTLNVVGFIDEHNRIFMNENHSYVSKGILQ